MPLSPFWHDSRGFDSSMYSLLVHFMMFYFGRWKGLLVLAFR